MSVSVRSTCSSSAPASRISSLLLPRSSERMLLFASKSPSPSVSLSAALPRSLCPSLSLSCVVSSDGQAADLLPREARCVPVVGTRAGPAEFGWFMISAYVGAKTRC